MCICVCVSCNCVRVQEMVISLQGEDFPTMSDEDYVCELLIDNKKVRSYVLCVCIFVSLFERLSSHTNARILSGQEYPSPEAQR